MIRRFILVLATVFCCFAQTAVFAAETEETDMYYIAWNFDTYARPDFESERTGLYTAREVNLLASYRDGWALTELEGKKVYVYLPDNLIYIDREMDLYSEKYGTKPAGSILPQVVHVLSRSSDDWLFIETWLGRKWVNIAAIKPETRLDIEALDQRVLGYPTGCEVVSLAMALSGVTEVDVHELIAEMPRSQNPELGFRGDPATKGGFTILPPALLELTESYAGSAADLTGGDLDSLKAHLSSGKAVVVWVNGLGFNVHALCLTGYDAGGFYYNDPWRGSKDSYISFEKFYKIWDKAIVDGHTGESFDRRLALSY